jgi:hypothetical protein
VIESNQKIRKQDKTHMNQTTYPVGTLFRERSAEFFDWIRNADIVIGTYPSGSQTVFFGRAALEEIVATGDGAMLWTVYVDVDPATDDIEFLAACCITQKGACDYQEAGSSFDCGDGAGKSALLKMMVKTQTVH